MVEAASHLKLLPTSILDIYKVFEHIGMLSTGIQYQLYTVIPTLLVSVWGSGSLVESKGSHYVMVEADRFWESGSHVESNDVIMSYLRLKATPICFLHPY